MIESLRFLSYLALPVLLFSAPHACHHRGRFDKSARRAIVSRVDSVPVVASQGKAVSHAVVVSRDVCVKDYFDYMDSVLAACDSACGTLLTEHILVHANAWIIDTLESFDYYRRMQHGEFIADQKEMVVLHRGDMLRIPSPEQSQRIRTMLDSMLIDVNIPEYRLRIFNGDSVWYTFPVRVGRNERKYLKTAGRVVDLRTPVGEGSIVRIEKDPWYINPVDGHRYHATWRDDGKLTRLPRIPFLEPEINGRRQGSLIHPTTNEATLGKAYSNGCVGLGEAAAWRVYYCAPLGTRVRFRYDLSIRDGGGRISRLVDIYGYGEDGTSLLKSP